MSTVIKFDEVSKRFDDQILYTDVNIKILEGEKILLCGENGCGKTTLIRMITGEIQPDTGTVFLEKEVKIAKLEQFENLAVNNTVDEYIENIFGYITALEKEIRLLENSFTVNYSEKVANEYAQLLELFDTIGGYTYLKKKDEFVHIFGFESILNRSVNTLSGGEQQYLRLASTIFSDASILILDEPFTFLDKGKTFWLLEFLKKIEKTIIIISHDFNLVQEFVTSIINIKDWKIKKYKNGYEDFLKESSLERERNSQYNTTLDNYIAKRIESIEKRKQWMKKAENKHQHAVMIRRLERDVDKAEKSKNKQKRLKSYNISAMIKNDANDSHELLISLMNVSLTYDKACILNNISLDIYANQHYLILGENGAGKTTLLNLIMKNIAPSQGSITYTKKIIFSSLTQFDFYINVKMTCLDVLSTILNYTKDEWISKYSEYFEPDFWDKRISVLSGGELKKFLIFTCLLKDFDILVLDEPTTFVDIQTKYSIIKMLNSCNKCIIIVTHDSDVFMNMAGTKLIMDNGKINLLE